MIKIRLTQNKVALIDDCDLNDIEKFKWIAVRNRKSWYAIAWDKTTKPRRQIKMHRLLLGVTDPKLFVDHKDNNGLNNQRNNIRIATPSQNKMNVTPFGKSKYLGVTITKQGKYRACIVVNKKYHHLGNFSSEEEAAKERDKAAKKYHGEFARLNFRDK